LRISSEGRSLTGKLPYYKIHSVYLDGPHVTIQNIRINFHNNNLTKNFVSGNVEFSYMFYTDVLNSVFTNNSVYANRQEYMEDDNGKVGFLYQSQQDGWANVTNSNFANCITSVCVWGGNILLQWIQDWFREVSTKSFNSVVFKDNKWDSFISASEYYKLIFANVFIDNSVGAVTLGIALSSTVTFGWAKADSSFDCEALDAFYGSNTSSKPSYSFCPTTIFSSSSQFTQTPPPSESPFATLGASPFPTLSASSFQTPTASPFPNS
jgi:hypothetical protein